jgi:hypothetical protein
MHGDTTFKTGEPLSSAGGLDVFVAKLEPTSGQVVWSKRFGDTGDQEALGVTVDDANEIYLSGTFSNAIHFDPGSGPGLISGGLRDMFLAKLDAFGGHGWSTRYANGEPEEPRFVGAVAVPQGGVLLAAGWAGPLALDDPEALPPQGGLDAVLAKFAP